MNEGEPSNRRLFLAATGFGLAPLVAAAQQTPSPPSLPFPARDFGSLHRAMLERISDVLSGTPLASKEGLFKIVDFLVEFGLLSKAEGESLKRIISAVVDSPTVEEMSKVANDVYNELKKKAGDLAVAIASIARDSIEYAKKLANEIGTDRLVYIVSADVTGALTGAAACVKFPRPFAVIGALAGAVAGSGNAAFGSAPKK